RKDSRPPIETAALRVFDPAYARFGSFTSFPPSRCVRFAPRADIRPMRAFMRTRLAAWTHVVEPPHGTKLFRHHHEADVHVLRPAVGADAREAFAPPSLRTTFADRAVSAAPSASPDQAAPASAPAAPAPFCFSEGTRLKSPFCAA